MMVKFSTITELAGDEVTSSQLKNCIQRYYWAGKFCKEKRILEVGCGTGAGLGYLSEISRCCVAGDYTLGNLKIAKSHYRERIPLLQIDAQELPFRDRSIDVLLLLETIYYLPEADKFLRESRRILSKEGRVLIVTVNKDIFGFNPSPFSSAYYGVVELKALLAECGFSCEIYGVNSSKKSSLRKTIVRWLKCLGVVLNLIPKTMEGKKWLKKIIFGGLVRLPREIKGGMDDFLKPSLLDSSKLDSEHEILFCSAYVKEND
jgi:ubiquinone/menaquinone biosynthesis C-methylase UbiE